MITRVGSGGRLVFAAFFRGGRLDWRSAPINGTPFFTRDGAENRAERSGLEAGAYEVREIATPDVSVFGSGE